MGILCTPNCALSSLPTDAPNDPAAEEGTPRAQGSVQDVRGAWPGAGPGIPVIPTESSPSGLELGGAEVKLQSFLAGPGGSPPYHSGSRLSGTCGQEFQPAGSGTPGHASVIL